MKRALRIILIILSITSLLITGCTLKIETNTTESTTPKPSNEETKDEEENNEQNENDDNDIEDEKDPIEEKGINIKVFIPNGDYKVVFSGNDFTEIIEYIKGDGTSFQAIGRNGKGPFINVYSLVGDGIYQVYTGELTEEEMNDIVNVSYLNKRNMAKETVILSSPIVIGTRWDNKEIVEIGENLKLDTLVLNGVYVKTWEKEIDGDNEIIKVCYYSEGLGCVQYRYILNGTIMEESTLILFEKK